MEAAAGTAENKGTEQSSAEAQQPRQTWFSGTSKEKRKPENATDAGKKHQAEAAGM